MGPPDLFLKLTGEIYTAVAITTVVCGVCGSAPRGPLRDQCDTTIARLLQGARTRQSYAFASWIEKIPEALAALGWLLTEAERRATRFLERHAPDTPLSSVISVSVRATDNAILLECPGSTKRVVAAPGQSASRAADVAAAISAITFPRKLMPELFTHVDDGSSTAWLDHGQGGVGDFIDRALSEDPGSPTTANKRAFLDWAWRQVERTREKFVSCLGRGEAVALKPWMFSEIGAEGSVPVKIEATTQTETVELAMGPVWRISVSALPPGTTALTVSPSAALGGGFFIR